MQNKRTIFFIFLFSFSFICRAQDALVIQEYIKTYKDAAIEEMHRTGVPASIKLAQGIHETMAGTSSLVLKSNNHFGIKCKDTWRGASVKHTDDAPNECFRKYDSPIDSYKDHSNFLRNSSRYASLFNLDPTDYEGWAWGLKKAGYATNTRYPQVIIKLIQDYHLQDYTLIAMGKDPLSDETIVTAIVKTDVKEKVTEDEIVKIGDPVKTKDQGKMKAGKMKDVNKEFPKSDKIEYQEKETLYVSSIEVAKKQTDYPTGEFKLNETKVIYAKKGISFLAIAEQYNLPLARIFEFNDMPQSESLNKDQLIYLQRKRKTGNNEFHNVEPGETLNDIAQSEALRLESLLEYNYLKADMKPAIGEKLYLRSKASQAPKLMLKENYSLAYTKTPEIKTGTSAGFFTCTVQSKETIYSIAKRYNVKINDIVLWNQLEGYDLKMGQELKIYK